ncbi:MAG: hypothetical protein H0X33_14410 [Taibaiella sp.]|nr:hypothetical protein [Taibaiella sp.]
MSKQVDFTQTGGIPRNQDLFAFMQTGYTEAIKALAAMTAQYGLTLPVIVSGMVPDGSGGTTDGWVWYNGDLVHFPAISVGIIPTCGGGTVLTWIIAANNSNLTFGDTTVKPVLQDKAVTLSCSSAGLTSTTIPYSTVMLNFNYGLREQSWTHIVVSAGATTGDIYYKKNWLTNTLQIRGSLVIGTGVSAPPVYNFITTLPAAYKPANTTPFKAFFRYHSSTLEESTSLDYIRDINCELDSTGGISVGSIRGATNYTVYFNQLIPLD